MREIYLDNAATTPCDSKVLKAMEPYWSKIYGNPSSFNDAGRKAKKTVVESRKKIARILGAKEKEILFVSSATEANNTAIFGIAEKIKKDGFKILTTAIEHHSVLEPLKKLSKKRVKITYLSVNKEGLINLKEFEKSLTPDTKLISIIYANNEIGSVQPIKKIAKIIKEFRKNSKFPYFHIDAVQATSYLDINVNNLGVDLMTLSSHKIYGPKGIALLYIKNGVEIEPLIYGGGQESGFRSGTEAVPLIVGFAKALEESDRLKIINNRKMEELRKYFISGLKKDFSDIKTNGPENQKDRLPNIISATFPEIENEQLLLRLDKYGIRASAGAACSSKEIEPSHILSAIGLTKNEARSTIRFSLGKQITRSDINYVLKILPKMVKKIESLYPAQLKKQYYI